jgi:hypothetical protein
VWGLKRPSPSRVVAVLAGLAALLMYRERNKMQSACDARVDAINKLLAEQYEKRLSDALTVLGAINRNSDTLGDLGSGLVSRGEAQAIAMQRISEALTSLAQDFTLWKQQQQIEQTASRSFWADKVKNLETQLSNALQALGTLEGRISQQPGRRGG